MIFLPPCSGNVKFLHSKTVFRFSQNLQSDIPEENAYTNHKEKTTLTLHIKPCCFFTALIPPLSKVASYN